MQLLSSFELVGFSHNQVAVFDPSLEHPFNDWLPQHTAQGFTWRPESVSFGTLGQGALENVEVWVAQEVNINTDTVRAILVPFSVGPSASVAVQSIASNPDSNIISVPQGKYSLGFETGFREVLRNDPDYQGRFASLLPTWGRFTFMLRKSARPEILRADDRLAPIYPLLMEANPA